MIRETCGSERVASGKSIEMLAKNIEMMGRDGDIMEGDDEPCEQCGLCCKIYGDRISPTITDLFHWLDNDRHDILKYFCALKSDGSWINCASLKPNELGDLIRMELRDPSTGKYLPGCPFLRRASQKKYICAIHEVKPEMCGNYLPWVWGETYFNKCRALKRKERRFISD